MPNTVTFEADISLINSSDDFLTEEGDFKEAIASYGKNPEVNWGKFILTNDSPNKNKQRVPIEEFENLINSGVYMPVKMAEELPLDHKNARAIGAITNLKQVDNKIVGLAVLWRHERPEDVKKLKEAYENGVPPQLSWELYYETSEKDDETGVETLRGTTLLATTVVSSPAYAGKTPFTAIASDHSVEEHQMDELEKLNQALASKEEEIAGLNAKIAELTPLEAEVSDLRRFKEETLAEAAKKEKKCSVKDKFKQAGIEKPDTYFDENEELLFSMSEAELNFMVNEIVAGLEAAKSELANASVKNPNVPNLNGDDSKITKDDVLNALKNRRK